MITNILALPLWIKVVVAVMVIWLIIKKLFSLHIPKAHATRLYMYQPVAELEEYMEEAVVVQINSGYGEKNDCSTIVDLKRTPKVTITKTLELRLVEQKGVQKKNSPSAALWNTETNQLEQVFYPGDIVGYNLKNGKWVKTQPGEQDLFSILLAR